MYSILVSFICSVIGLYLLLRMFEVFILFFISMIQLEKVEMLIFTLSGLVDEIDQLHVSIISSPQVDDSTFFFRLTVLILIHQVRYIRKIIRKRFCVEEAFYPKMFFCYFKLVQRTVFEGPLQATRSYSLDNTRVTYRPVSESSGLAYMPIVLCIICLQVLIIPSRALGL